MSEGLEDGNIRICTQNLLRHLIYLYWLELLHDQLVELNIPLLLEVAPLTPLELTNILDVILDSKSQDSWIVSIYLEHISRDTILDSGSALVSISPKTHRTVGASYNLVGILLFNTNLKFRKFYPLVGFFEQYKGGTNLIIAFLDVFSP